ncbi:hypothetical protein HHK36_026828 [Tetracentron sinense]|uniref:Pentatricopeptide repeat-containing protein n=1 Tax=Tetracentron sinense TaxID=13715 RepID=A0A834YLG3_TETSI|nr:hypothetical protein HHK36_026828 [Tetracentron sinense]
MSGKLQPLDTSCFHILGSTKSTSNIGVSVSLLDGVESIKQPRENILRESTNVTGKRTGRIYRKYQNGRGDGILGPGLDYSSLVKNTDGEERRKVGDYRSPETKSDGAVKFSSRGKNSLKGKRETKCSTKWLSYGGCIPSMLQALETEKNLDEALKPWEETLNNKERSIILKEQSSWERAFEIFEWFKRKGCYELNVIHYNIMLRILGKARRWNQVENLWGEMKAKRIMPTNSTYGTLIDVYSKGGLKEEALLWLERMNKQGMEPDEVTMGIVVQTYKKAAEFEKAEQFFKKWSSGKLVKDGDRTTTTINSTSKSHTRFSSYTYNTLIDTYGKAGQLQEASDTFVRMLREGIVPNTVTFNTMIHICGNHGHLEEVASLMHKMEELQCPPDTRTYNILISLHAKHDNIKMAESYFKKMKDICLEPDPVSYRTLLYAFSIRHMVREAEALVSEMDDRGLEIDEFTQSALIRMYIDAGMLQQSWSWFERFHLMGKMSSECYSANIDAYGERSHILEAEKAFICCQERKKLSVLEFNVMIKAYGMSKKYDKACELFDSMENHGVFPDKCSYNSLIQILSGADLPHIAKPYVMKMQEAGLITDCIPYCAVISSFAKLGHLKMAEELFKEMVALDVQPDIVVFGVLINAFAEVGSVKEAIDYVDAMRNAGLPGNTVIYNSLIKLYTKVGYLQEAQEIYKQLQSSETGPAVYSSNCMIDLYSERAMVRQAEEILEDLKRKGEANEFSFAMMLCMYKRIGRFEEAVGIAQKMRELGLLTELLSYNNVIGLYASDGRLKEAVETFREMMKSAIQPDDSTFKSLGVVLVKWGVPKQAISKLEATRRKDANSGLHAWMTTLCSMIEVDDDGMSCTVDPKKLVFLMKFPYAEKVVGFWTLMVTWPEAVCNDRLESNGKLLVDTEEVEVPGATMPCTVLDINTRVSSGDDYGETNPIKIMLPSTNTEPDSILDIETTIDPIEEDKNEIITSTTASESDNIPDVEKNYASEKDSEETSKDKIMAPSISSEPDSICEIPNNYASKKYSEEKTKDMPLSTAAELDHVPDVENGYPTEKDSRENSKVEVTHLIAAAEFNHIVDAEMSFITDEDNTVEISTMLEEITPSSNFQTEKTDGDAQNSDGIEVTGPEVIELQDIETTLSLNRVEEISAPAFFLTSGAAMLPHPSKA